MQRAGCAILMTGLLLAFALERSASADHQPQNAPKKNSGRGPVPDYIKARVRTAQQAEFLPSRQLRSPARGTYRVAAIQFGFGNLENSRHKLPLDAVSSLIRKAARNGAKLIVTPEYALDSSAERDPRVGTNVIRSNDYGRNGAIDSMGRLARQLGVTIVFHTRTLGGTLPPEGEQAVRDKHWAFRYDPARLKPEDAVKLKRFQAQLLAEAKRPRQEYFDAAVAVDKSGTVVANHHKFHSAWTAGTRGTSLDNSCFMTPAGKVGILVCADGQEAIKKMPKNPRNPDKKLLKQFIDRTDLVAIAYPTMWMAKGPGNMWRWKSVNQQSILAQVTKAWVIASNNNDGVGPGGGIYKPDGKPVESSINSKAEIHYGDMPLQRR